MSIIGTLILAWFLTLFDLDTILVSAINEVLGTNYSTSVYWLAAVVIAVIGIFIELIVRKVKK